MPVPVRKPETPAWLTSILAAAREQFTPPTDVQGVMEVLRQLVQQEQTKQTIPGVPAIFNAPSKLQGATANLGIQSMEDMSSPGGAALNTLPEVLPMAGILAALFKKGDTPLAGLVKHAGVAKFPTRNDALMSTDKQLKAILRDGSQSDLARSYAIEELENRGIDARSVLGYTELVTGKKPPPMPKR